MDSLPLRFPDNMKNRLYRFLPFILLFILAQAAFAQQAPSTAPDVEALKKHVGYLASDELEGRRPGTVGANKAADYIAEEFHRLKLGCASNLGEGDLKCRHNGKRRDGYLKEFPFIAEVVLSKNNSMSFTRGGKNNAVAIDAEWTPLGFSSNGAVAQAGLVFAGHGITAADLKHDDYEPRREGQSGRRLCGVARRRQPARTIRTPRRRPLESGRRERPRRRGARRHRRRREVRQ